MAPAITTAYAAAAVTEAKSPSRLDRAAFVAAYGAVYEESPWIAEAAYDSRGGTHDDADGLAGRMRGIVEAAGTEKQLALLRAHPELADRVRLAGDMADASRTEQRGAGLDQCTEEEFAAFRRLNRAYRERHGFPFIIAVAGLDRRQILTALEARVANDTAAEFRAALDQVHRIARIRLGAPV